MKGVSMTVKVVMGMTILLILAVILVSLLGGQNQNLIDFGTGTISGSINNTTG
jgi:uncharacterized membrane protein YciS (DUF1049 family)